MQFFQAKEKAPTKKEQILELWQRGQHDLWHIAEDLSTQPSYVASVLQEAGQIQGYYDLYTSPEQSMNVYFSEFRGRLGFKDIPTAERSVALIDQTYEKLKDLRDRAGQHHCLVTALTMFNRARFIGKKTEAQIFRHWIEKHLLDS